jgi:predicted Rossmann fold nucleotide-binding protein DprA/Smf involved in DNA uptake
MAMPHPNEASTLFALLLRALPGFGQQSLWRITRAFEDLSHLRSFPREHVLAHLKGIPNRSEKVQWLFDDQRLAPQLAEAEAAARDLTHKKVDLIRAARPPFFAQIDPLPKKVRPSLLYQYGPPMPSGSRVGFLARGALSETAFSWSETVLDALPDSVTVITGIHCGFDVVASKRRERITHLSIDGFSQIEPTYRPTVIASLKRGGGLLSSKMPSEQADQHDWRTRAWLMAALCDDLVVLDADHAFEDVQHWCAQMGKRTWQVSGPTAPPTEALLDAYKSL